MVDAVDVDIVYVQMQPAIGLLDNRIDELEFAHLVNWGLHIKRCILNRDAPFQYVLSLSDSLSDILYCIGCERNRQEVIQMTVITAVGKMLGIQLNLMQVEKASYFSIIGSEKLS